VRIVVFRPDASHDGSASKATKAPLRRGFFTAPALTEERHRSMSSVINVRFGALANSSGTSPEVRATKRHLSREGLFILWRCARRRLATDAHLGRTLFPGGHRDRRDQRWAMAGCNGRSIAPSGSAAAARAIPICFAAETPSQQPNPMPTQRVLGARAPCGQLLSHLGVSRVLDRGPVRPNRSPDRRSFGARPHIV
jgi:hypothetical protein